MDTGMRNDGPALATVGTRSPRTVGQTTRPKTDDELIQHYYPSQLRWSNLAWGPLFWIVGMHIGAVVALFYFSWQAVAIMVFLQWLTGSIGVCLCYHRYLSHKSFEMAWPVRFFCYLCGALSVEGPPLTWAANHRVHHARSDQPGDPHSPHDGNWWSHMLWLFIRRPADVETALQQRFVPDLVTDPMLQFFQRTFILWSFALAGLLYWLGGWPFVLWGMCMRMVFVYHTTWFVNSATHLWGYRNYETKDDSKNLWWVGILAFGEGWHNNHHAYPRVARTSHRWWEVDVTWWAIRTLQMLGLAWNVCDKLPPTSKRIQPAKTA